MSRLNWPHKRLGWWCASSRWPGPSPKWLGRPVISISTASTGVWRSAAPGSPRPGSGPTSTRKQNICSCGTPLRRLGCIRVEFKTDALNTKSRQALARIGATEEGTFRNHMIMPGGRIRHGVYCSVTDNEWPRVKAHLRIECRAD